MSELAFVIAVFLVAAALRSLVVDTIAAGVKQGKQSEEEEQP